MKTKLVSSAFASITILLIAGCASMTMAPSEPPSATVSIREWSAAYYASAAAGKGTLYYHGQRHHFTISGLGAGGMGYFTWRGAGVQERLLFHVKSRGIDSLTDM